MPLARPTHTKFMNKMMRFFIYGLVGLAVEVVYTGFASLLHGDWAMHGNTFLVMLPVYGLAVFLEPVHERLLGHPWWVRGFVYLALIWGIEYMSGAAFTVLLGHSPWYYEDPLNIHGYITLRMAPEWFVAGLGFEKLHAFLNRIQLRA